jgi:hypothetical protein
MRGIVKKYCAEVVIKIAKRTKLISFSFNPPLNKIFLIVALKILFPFDVLWSELYLIYLNRLSYFTKCFCYTYIT